MRNRNQNGVTYLTILLIAVVVAVAGFVGWWVWHNNKEQSTFPDCVQIGASTSDQTPKTSCKKSSTANSYAECLKSPDSKMIETYPEQCVTKDGATYPNPDQVGSQLGHCDSSRPEYICPD